MNQRDDKHLRENITPSDVYTKNFLTDAANEPFIKDKQSIDENDSIKKVEELWDPYYDEFHFANYE